MRFRLWQRPGPGSCFRSQRRRMRKVARRAFQASVSVLIDVSLGASASTAGTMTVSCTGTAPKSSVHVCVGLGPGNVSHIQRRSADDGGDWSPRVRAVYPIQPASRLGTESNTSAPSTLVRASRRARARTSMAKFSGIRGARRQAATLNSINPVGDICLQIQAGMPSLHAARRPGSPRPARCRSQRRSSPTATSPPPTSTSAPTVPADFQQPIDGQSTITVACTQGTSYTIALDGGKASAADPTQRQMTNPSGNIAYGALS